MGNKISMIVHLAITLFWMFNSDNEENLKTFPQVVIDINTQSTPLIKKKQDVSLTTTNLSEHNIVYIRRICSFDSITHLSR